MGQFEDKNYYKAGSFRVHGPYITEKGEDTVDFNECRNEIVKAERKLAFFLLKYSKKICYVQNFDLTRNTKFFIAIKNGRYDLGVCNIDGTDRRIDISQSEYEILLKQIQSYVARLCSALKLAEKVKDKDLAYKMSSDPYFKKYDPTVNPVRGSPENKRYNKLFDRGAI